MSLDRSVHGDQEPTGAAAAASPLLSYLPPGSGLGLELV